MIPVQKRQKWLRDMQVLLDDPAIQKLLAQSPQSELEREIYRRLRDAASPPPQLGKKGSLSLPKVAHFLAWLAFCETEQLAWVRDAGLRWLGIGRVAKKAGRPPGRKKSASYLDYLRVAETLINEDRIWARKLDLRSRHPDWQKRLRRELKRDGWTDETVDFVLTARTSRSLAIYMVSRHFDVSYDAVDKGVQRARSAQE
jgi:hypothetical protein